MNELRAETTYIDLINELIGQIIYYMEYQEKLHAIKELIDTCTVNGVVYDIASIHEDIMMEDNEKIYQIASLKQCNEVLDSVDCKYASEHKKKGCSCDECPYDDQCFEDIIVEIEEYIYSGYSYSPSVDEILYELFNDKEHFSNRTFKCFLGCVDEFTDLFCSYSSESYDQLSELERMDYKNNVFFNHPQRFMFQEFFEGDSLSSLYKYGKDYIITNLVNKECD